MQHILPEELPRLSCFLPAARVNAPGDMVPNVCPQSPDSPHHSFPRITLYFTPLYRKEMTSQGFYQWLYEKAEVFCLLIKKDFPTVYYYQCSTLRMRLLKSASSYHQLPEEWPFSLLLCTIKKSRTDYCLFLSPKYVIKISTYFLWKWSSVLIFLSKTWE